MTDTGMNKGSATAMESKVCRRCGEAKPLAVFPRNSMTCDGHTHYCWDCHQQNLYRCTFDGEAVTTRVYFALLSACCKTWEDARKLRFQKLTGLGAKGRREIATILEERHAMAGGLAAAFEKFAASSLSTHAQNTLWKLCPDGPTAQRIAQFREADLWRLPDVGLVTINEIGAWLMSNGLDFGASPLPSWSVDVLDT